MSPRNGSRDRAPFMTVIEIAELMRVSRATVYRLIHTGDLPSMRVGRSLRVSRRALENYLYNATPGYP